MKKYDLIVIGGGSGLNVATPASSRIKVAVVEQGPLGGTCLNRGCIPTKILVHVADVIKTLKSADKFGISSGPFTIDFLKVMESSWVVDEEARQIESALRNNPNIDLYKGTAEFIDDHTIFVNGKEIWGEKIVIAAGTRPSVPRIKGLDNVPYMTSKEILKINHLPRDLLVVGGGYIATELAYFFNEVGSNVTVLQRNVRLLPREDIDISKFFTEEFSKHCNVKLRFETSEVEKKGDKIIIYSKNGDSVEGTDILIATGRTPNSDILKVEKAGIKTNSKGYIEANEYLQTNKEHIWVLGDIAGRYLFKHTANAEAEVVLRNIFGMKNKMDYTAIPHAVFSNPQIAGVGYTEQELEGKEYLTSKYYYSKTGMGLALKEEGFVKFITDYDKNILGCHIVGPHASQLIHEVLVSLRAGSGNIKDITNTMHIHPALNEVVERAAKQI